MTRRVLLLLAVTADTTATAALPTLPLALRLIPGLLLVLVLPGAALIVALGLHRRLALPICALLAVGLSVCLTILVGLLLDLLPTGVSRPAVAAALGTLTAAAAVIALLRWQPLPPATQLRGPRLAEVAALAVAGLLAATAVTVAATAAVRAEDRVAFSQLWLLPAGPGQARLGVRSHEQNPQAYDLTLRAAAGGGVVGQWALRLRPGQSWQVTAPLPGSPPGPVVAELRRPGIDQQPYREVQLAPARPVLPPANAAARRVAPPGS